MTQLKLCFLLLSALLIACASAPTQQVVDIEIGPSEPLFFKFSLRPSIPVYGLIDVRDSGQGANYGLMYQGGSYASLIAQIAAHAAIESAKQSGANSRLQNEADQIVEPYQSAIDSIDEAKIWRRSISQVPRNQRKQLRIWSAAESSGRWSIELQPSYFISPDEDAILAQTEMLIHKDGMTESPAGRQLVAVSMPTLLRRENGEVDDTAFREALLQINTQLIQMAILAAQSWNDPITSDSKTWSYYQGTNKRFERASLIYKQCNRAIIQTLRADWMSVPLSRKTSSRCSQTQ